MKSTTTPSQNSSQVTRQWFIIDASKQALGRTASEVAKLLNGKHKATFTPHVDGGDYVIVINAENIPVTGKKELDKTYYRHSGHPGSTKSRTLQELKKIDARKVIFKAVRGMIPANKLRDGKLARLKIYLDENHQQDAQKPVKHEVK